MTKVISGVTYRVKYMHMSRIDYNVGGIVDTIDVVGLTGDLGQASGCHIHIGVHRWYNSQWYSIPPRFCGRTYPDNATLWRGC